MKKLVAALLCMTLLVLFANVGSNQATPDSTIQFVFERKIASDGDTTPVGNTTMIPLQIVSEELGIKLLWNKLINE